MNSKIAIMGIGIILMVGCGTTSRTTHNPPEYISVDGSGPDVEKNSSMAAGVPFVLLPECTSGRNGLLSLAGIKMICEPVAYDGQPVKGAFKISDFAKNCGNVPSLYLREGEPVRLMLIKTSDRSPTKDYLKNTLKMDEAHIEGATLLIVQDIPQPKYLVSCDDRAVLVIQRTNTIPEGPFKTRALNVAEKFNQFTANQGILN